MKRRERESEKIRVRPPQRLLEPTVQDWVSPEEPAVDLGLSPLYRQPSESDVSWRYRQMASQRWSAAVRQWRSEHPHADMSSVERRNWLLLTGSGGTPCRWRDRAADWQPAPLTA